MLAEVKILSEATVQDIPDMLREMADRIENGEFEADQAVFVMPQEDRIEVFMWGDTDHIEAHYILHQAMMRLVGV